MNIKTENSKTESQGVYNGKPFVMHQMYAYAHQLAQQKYAILSHIPVTPTTYINVCVHSYMQIHAPAPTLLEAVWLKKQYHPAVSCGTSICTRTTYTCMYMYIHPWVA